MLYLPDNERYSKMKCNRCGKSSVPQMEKAVRILKELGTPCLVHQPNYSMFDRWVEEGLLDFLENEGIGASKVSQVDDCVGALANREFSKDELEMIDKILMQ